MDLLKKIAYLILCSILIWTCKHQDKPPAPVIKDGIIDLRSWDFEKNGTINLDGDWEFYWEKLLTQKDFLNTENKVVRDGFNFVPGTWEGSLVRNEKLPGHGFATYSIKILLKDSDEFLGLRFGGADSAYLLYREDELLLKGGVVGRSFIEESPQWISQIKFFKVKSNEARLILHLSNHTYRRARVWNHIVIGTPAQISGMRSYNIGFELFIFGSLLIMGIYHIAFYLLRRTDELPLYFGIFCLLTAIRILILGETLIMTVFPGLDREITAKIEYLCFYVGVPIFLTFLSKIFPEDFNISILRPFQIISTLFSLFTLIAPLYVYRHGLEVFQIVTLIGAVYFLYLVGLATYRKREAAKFFLIGSSFFVICVVNDILNDNLIVETVYLAPFGFLVFNFSQAFLLSSRFSKAFRKVEELSAELTSNNIRLEQLNRVKDEFLANTSHELKTPLTGIIGISESLIEGSAGTLNIDIRENLKLIVYSARKLSNLVNDILDFSQLKNNELILNKKPVDIYQAVKLVFLLAKPSVRNKDINFVNSISPTIGNVYADETRVLQILHNIIGNACKFTEKGEVKVHAKEIKGFIYISVEDTGIGIAEEELNSIFASFEQIDPAITRKYGGVGLGLRISQKLVELHGGIISVDSSPGKGSIFTFSLPALKEDKEKSPYVNIDRSDLGNLLFSQGLVKDSTLIEDKQENTPIISNESMKNFSLIYVVDDELVNLRVIDFQLKMNGYEVQCFRSGIEVLNQLESAQKIPDLILLDVMMPGMSGFDVARKIREKFPPYELPILLLTAKTQIEDIAIGLDSGANDYLNKPFHKKELSVRVKNLVALKKMVEDNNRLIVFEKELEIARKIQEEILPSYIPDIPGLKIQIQYLPMQKVGGDFYDFFINSNSSGLGVIIADAAGHGISASIISGMVKFAFIAERDFLMDPAQLLSGMNKSLMGFINKSFVTASYTYIDLIQMKLISANAGHPSLYFIRKSECKLISVKPPGKILGRFADLSVKNESLTLQKGDVLLFYTDGIMEVRNSEGAFYSDERFETFLRSRIESKFDLNDLLSDVQNWSQAEEFEDDIALLAIEIQ